MGMARAAEELRQRARTSHKRPPLAEDDGVAAEGRLPAASSRWAWAEKLQDIVVD